MVVWGEPLHPTQLYAVCLSLAIFYILWRRRLKKRFDGEVFWLYVLLDGVSRMFVDHFRGDFRGVLLGNLVSVSQIIGGLLICLAAGVLIKKRQAM